MDNLAKSQWTVLALSSQHRLLFNAAPASATSGSMTASRNCTEQQQVARVGREQADKYISMADAIRKTARSQPIEDLFGNKQNIKARIDDESFVGVALHSSR